MKTRIIAAAAFSLSLGTAAMAQTTDMETGYGAGMPAGWEGEISEALFEDGDTGVLRSEAEVRDNFEELSPDQQAMIRSHCALVDTAGTTGYRAGTDDLAQDLDTDLDDDLADLDTDTEIEMGATEMDGDRDDDLADLDLDEEIETGATEFDDEVETDTAAGTSLDDEIETGATIGSTSDVDTGVERGTDMGATSDLDSEFETGEADPGVDSEIETGATGTTDLDEFETETEFGQDMDDMGDAQITASIEQVCGWIDQ